MTGPAVTPALVRALYRQHLGREAESEEAVAGHVARHGSLDALIATIAGSDEARERQRRSAAAARMQAWRRRSGFPPGARRILLFGAYGNGNLGDAAQAEAVAALLQQAAGVPLHLHAVSWIDAAPDYPFDPASRLPAEAITAPDTLRLYDLLVIGGGGLFGAVHHPLLDPEWHAVLAGLPLPYALVGVGADSMLPKEPQLGPHWDGLRAGAAFLSGRDLASLSAMPEAHWLADPVLLAWLRAGRGTPRPPRPGARPLCIVKHAQDAAEAQFLDQVAALGSDCDVAAIEPCREQHLAARWPGIRFVTDWAELEALCAAASVVVSARYHGCIAGLLAGVPCLAAAVGKTWVLFDTLGQADRFIPAGRDLRPYLENPPPPLAGDSFRPMLQAGEMALHQLGALLRDLPLRAGA
ncbi:polysaccharide pyruvyl transferase family protein [Paracraurococcus lichenis]|uniref:Polysaccharide pyruvyl transferase family protein n=1 Tax=Paracraurococcus lichenis TaxID=3064888 RepID=A0ABT9DX40_9PROT|nr:polysaccharide pyruvyl transferase family protein [Paracraurococcus sp. LOR1-02]MDO9708462.1 polysaccharide pyruvyl transferase family protein [Paracraurococcus sp. LOR1-02]